jgi:hypothetical protein
MAKNRKPDPIPPDATRASVTFPLDLYKQLEEIAKQKKVSVAWVVRDAAERYVVAKALPKAAARRSMYSTEREENE